MKDDLWSVVNVLAPDGGVVEVRALADGVTHSGYFDDYEALARAVEALDADPSVAGIYVTLNSVNPALLARRANRIKLRLSRKDATTADADIIRRRWFPVDIDPVRPSGVSSTDAEHDARRWPRRSGSRPTSRNRGSGRPSGPTRATAPTSSTGSTSQMMSPRPRL